MTNQEYVIRLYKREKELIKICNFNNYFDDNCYDMIQNLYVTILEHPNIDRYIKNGDINMYLIFAILKNSIYQHRKKNDIFISTEIFEFDRHDDEYDGDAKSEIIEKEIEKIPYWFEKEIIKLYVYRLYNIRAIAKETKISFSTLQPIIHNFRISCANEYSKVTEQSKSK